MNRNHHPKATATALFALALLLPGAAGQADDTELFSATVPPNVVLLVDNSGSMAHIVWHEDFDPGTTYSCNKNTGGWNPDNGTETQFFSSDVTVTACGTTRTYYVDPEVIAAGFYTRFDERYLNWLHSLPDADPRLADIAAQDNGTFSSCLGGGTFDKYRRARSTAAKDILREVICQVNAQGEVRFGIAQFRADGDPRGGHLAVAVDDFSPAQDTLIEDFVDDLSPETWTPLGEALFQIYTYFMSRTNADIPVGQDGSTKFPKYVFGTSTQGSGGPVVSNPPDSPVQWACQKNFVVVITDGEPTRDDFDGSSGTAVGFDDFDDLIGDYNPDNLAPEAGNENPGSSPNCSNCEVALYLDDIAKYMQENDFRPDLNDDAGIQKVDVYTVGFTTDDFANDLLEKTAAVGGGEFFFSNDAESLAENIIAAITDIIEKSQSFTAATVPASRTVEGERIYVSFFIPGSSAGPWEGHLKNFGFNADGEIIDADGNCVVDEPGTAVNAPPCDTLGTLRTNADGAWDAADELGASTARSLYTSRVAAGAGVCGDGVGSQCVAFDAASVTAADLGITDWASQSPAYEPETNSTDAEELADEIVEYGRGCELGSAPCDDRTVRLGDIFHSNPIVVGPPNAPINDETYIEFALDHARRSRVIYAGANDGFLHAFQAGEWDSGASPPGLDIGTGEELFGFMPYAARQAIKELPIDEPPRDQYYVDGSPQVGDVWIPADRGSNVHTKTDWHTYVIGGLRQGGRSVYALDVTNPPGNPDNPSGYASYPSYAWEFPCEDALCDEWREYMGETWSEPVITRVRVKMAEDGPGSEAVYERWVAIFAAGYDPAGDPNDHAAYDDTDDVDTSRAGRAIFMIDIDSGTVLAWKRFDHVPLASVPTPPADAQTEMSYAIASTPAVFDLDFDGYADVIYVGDLGGNLWKWVVREPGTFTTNPVPDRASMPYNPTQPDWEFRKFFQAPVYTRSGTPYYKSIYFPPTGTLKSNTLYVAFGTGERNLLGFEGFDDTEDENNRFYVLKDHDRYYLNDYYDPSPYLGLLQEFHLEDITDGSNDCGNPDPDGYYIVARDSEKFISNSFIFLGDIWTGSFIPLNDVDPCTAGGSAFLYRFELTCGAGGFESEPTEADQRRKIIGPGIPTPVRISVGPPDPTDPNPECQSQVYMITSDGGLINECGGAPPAAGVKLLNWRER